MSRTSIAVRTVASLAVTFALLVLPIVLVSSLSRGDLIGLSAGILVFASSTLLLLSWSGSSGRGEAGWGTSEQRKEVEHAARDEAGRGRRCS